MHPSGHGNMSKPPHSPETAHKAQTMSETLEIVRASSRQQQALQSNSGAEADLLVDHEDDGHHVLEGSVRRVEVRPQVVLEVLADLEDHDALQRHGLPAPPLDAELGGIDLPDKVRVEGRRGGGRAPMLGGDAGEAVPLDVEERDGAAAG